MKPFQHFLVMLISVFGLVSAQTQSDLSIKALSSRSYDGGALVVERLLERNRSFTRSLVHWNSEGLRQYGFMDVPNTTGLHPVVIVIHGHVNPSTYRTLPYTTRYADALARAGFVVLHPNLRGHGLSQGKPDPLFRVGYALDVLNLIASLRAHAGKPGALERANPKSIGLFGHSMGGGIALRVITVDAGIRAALLYGAMSGDEQRNFQHISTVLSGGTRGLAELKATSALLAQISPIGFLGRIRAAVSIHHGGRDSQVPLGWSLELCQKLKALGKQVSCYTYPKAGHTFQGANDALLISRATAFFKTNLR